MSRRLPLTTPTDHGRRLRRRATRTPRNRRTRRGGRQRTATDDLAHRRRREAGSGRSDGSGTARLRVNPGTRVICYDLAVTGIEPATAAHVHVGSRDVAGPIVLALAAPTSGSSSDCTKVDRDLARDIASNPDDYYVNVHNAENPTGAVRGQLG